MFVFADAELGVPLRRMTDEPNETTQGDDQGQSEMKDIIYTIPITDADIGLRCAQELFSLFMLAVALQTAEVGGVSANRPKKESPRQVEWSNSVFDGIAAEVVKAKLVSSIENAMMLIIPAFALFDLLPTRDTGGEEVKFPEPEPVSLDESVDDE